MKNTIQRLNLSWHSQFTEKNLAIMSRKAIEFQIFNQKKDFFDLKNGHSKIVICFKIHPVMWAGGV